MPETQEGRTISPSINRHTSLEMDQVSKDFTEFLKNLHKPGREVLKQCRVFIMNVSTKKVREGLLCPAVAALTDDGFHVTNPNWHFRLSTRQELKADELSECVQDFYQSMADRLTGHFKGSISDLCSLQSHFIK